MHSAEWHERRLGHIGGSDANTIASGDHGRLYRLWLEKTRQAEPEDLSDVLPVQMGVWTEDFNAWWFEKQTGVKVERRSEWCIAASGPLAGIAACNLDGVADGALWEAKHVGGYEPVDTVVAKYMPQLHHNMHVIGSDRAILSILIGNAKWEKREVSFDPFYWEALAESELAFWRAVQDRVPPTGCEALAAPPVKAEKIVDLSTNNLWCSLAADYLALQPNVKKLDGVKAELKTLIEPDVAKAFGGGIIASRDKRGVLSIKESKE